MSRAGMLGLAALAGGALWWFARRAAVSKNVAAFLALIRHVEARDRYDVIAGGDYFDDYREHPFIVNPARWKPIGTTASGGYQMVRKTWMLARDNLGLSDFSPASQDAAAEWLLKFKVPGQHALAPEGTGIYALVEAGRFDEAMERLRLEWEAFERMARGQYHFKMSDAREFLSAQGAALA